VAKGARQILDAAGVESSLDRLAREIVEGGGGDLDRLAIIGIRRRGVPIAERLTERIGRRAGSRPRTGALDITLYRDDLTLIADQPVVHGTEIDFPVDGLRVVLTDDVLFTGRTVRSAIDAIFSLGRPAKIELAVLVDRGWRELPIEANYVAERLETRLDQAVHVNLSEIDEGDRIELVDLEEEIK
jgi:pyrimidine operon attenuation protein/uracil phosphoribosyltransferase